MAMSKISSLANSQRYFTLAIDSYVDRELTGRIFHSSKNGTIGFGSLIQMIQIIEGIFSITNYPMKTVDQRQFSFLNEQTIVRAANQEVCEIEHPELLRGSLRTLEIRVSYRYHATWQGEATWIESGEQVHFDSFLQLLKIIDHELDHRQEQSDDMNSNRVFRVAVDQYDYDSISGRIYQPPYEKELRYGTIMDLMKMISQSVDKPVDPLNPKPFDSNEVISERALEVYRSRGKKATFIIRILFTENATWQGSVSLKETGEKVNFRSFLELILLIDAAMLDYVTWKWERRDSLHA